MSKTKLSIPEMQTELARVNAELRKTNARYLPVKAALDADARTKFAASLKLKIAPVARPHFNALFAALQTGNAKPEMLTMLTHLIEAMPVHPKLAAPKIDISQGF